MADLNLVERIIRAAQTKPLVVQIINAAGRGVCAIIDALSRFWRHRKRPEKGSRGRQD